MGKTLRRNGKPSSGEMTFDCRVSDSIEVTEFLRQCLRKDKMEITDVHKFRIGIGGIS